MVKKSSVTRSTTSSRWLCCLLGILLLLGQQALAVSTASTSNNSPDHQHHQPASKRPETSTSSAQHTASSPTRRTLSAGGPHNKHSTTSSSSHNSASLLHDSIDASSYYHFARRKTAQPIFPPNYSFDTHFVHSTKDIEVIVQYGMKKYEERYHIPPPPQYDAWIRLAMSHNVSIDPEHYDQIHMDFWPHRNAQDPTEKTIHRSRLEAALRFPSPNTKHLLTGEIKDDSIHVNLKYSFDKAFNEAFAIGKHLLPKKLLFLVTDLDEPLSLDRDVEGVNADVPLPAEVFRHNKCLRDTFLAHNNASMDPVPLGKWHPFFKIYSNAYYNPPIDINKLPIFSRCKLDCYNDIVVPYYDFLFSFVDPAAESKPWEERSNRFIFRGKNSGSIVDATKQWKNSPRVRLVDWARSLNLTNPPYNLDVALSEAVNCRDKDECEELQKYVGNRIGKEMVESSKYVLVLDGNTWADRFDTQLSFGSLVFWSTMFTDWKYLQVKPFVHYIPVPMERSFGTLTRLLDWAHEHDELAKRIAHQGSQYAKQHFRRINYLLYILLVWMEYGRLYDDTK